MSPEEPLSILQGKSQVEINELFKPVIQDVLQVIQQNFESSPVPHQNTADEALEYILTTLSLAICYIYSQIPHIVAPSRPHSDLMQNADHFLANLRSGIEANIVASSKDKS